MEWTWRLNGLQSEIFELQFHMAWVLVLQIHEKYLSSLLDGNIATDYELGTDITVTCVDSSR